MQVVGMRVNGQNNVGGVDLIRQIEKFQLTPQCWVSKQFVLFLGHLTWPELHFICAIFHFLKYTNTPHKESSDIFTCIIRGSKIFVVNFSQRDSLGLGDNPIGKVLVLQALRMSSPRTHLKTDKQTNRAWWWPFISAPGRGGAETAGSLGLDA